MRVLFVYANKSRDLTAAPPVGLSYVATAARDAGHDVEVVDLLVAEDGERPLRRALHEHRPDVVGISVRNIDSCSKQRPAWQVGDATRHIEIVRESGSARVVLGGPAVSVLGPAVFESLPADYAVVGEGEIAFPALLAALARGEPARGIPGVYTRNGSTIDGTAPNRLPGFGPSGMERWIDWPAYRRRSGTWAIQTKRGCPMRCVYCAYPGIEGVELRRRTPQDVADEIEHVAATLRPRTFEIVDSTFNLPTSHAIGICEEIARRNLRVRLTTMGINPLGVTGELFRAMRRAGFRSMMVSPDAASDTTLAALEKGFTVRDVRRTARLAKASGMRSAWFFILGGPGETRETVDETLRFIETELNYPRCLSILMTGVRVLPGTAMAAFAVREGVVAPGHDYAAPTFYVSPAVEEDWIVARVQRALAKNPGIVYAAEQGISKSEWLFDAVLRALRFAPPYWRYLPILMRMPPLAQWRPRVPPAFASKDLRP
jgi:radical SAM superfamily enzyme YgiQ (UPF0313 family)